MGYSRDLVRVVFSDYDVEAMVREIEHDPVEFGVA